MGESFDDFVRRAFGGPRGPYGFQRRMAEEGLPDLLGVPTGCGKTVAGVLPWLWRSLVNAETAGATPRRLVYVLPMRTLVEQTVQEVKGWLKNLGLAETVQLHVLMGGEERDDDSWQLDPGAPAIFVGTQDMVLSRALMRGYAESRSRWPVSFGLLHSDTQWVFDETQLLGPALGTSAQLQGLRDLLGTPSPTRTMWMSATLDQRALQTAEHVEALRSRGRRLRELHLDEDDRQGELNVRLSATRRIGRLAVPDDPASYTAGLASQVADRHVPGTRTIVMVNTVKRAVEVYRALKHREVADGRVVLVHSHFRPAERRGLAERVKCEPDGAGQVVVASPALEAGVDVTSRLLVTEVAPWSSLVQRAGRCNRAGEWASEAELLWYWPPRKAAAPYTLEDLEPAAEALGALEGAHVTSEELQGCEVPQADPVYALIRRADLLQLFDTMPDLSGADVDVGPWIRDADERNVFLAWRDVPGDGLGRDERFPHREELCAAPVAEVRTAVTQKGARKLRLWVADRLKGGWRRAVSQDVAPGTVFVAEADSGGYEVEVGWSHQHRGRVEPVPRRASAADSLGSDRRSYGYGKPVTLVQHLADVEREASEVVASLRARLGGLGPLLSEAVVTAAKYHDLGKCHKVMQDTLLSTMSDSAADGGPWAKSAGESRSAGHSRRYFRHELVSALMLLHPDCPLLEMEPEPDLVAYLAAAHHGKVRVSVRSVADEAELDPPLILGVKPVDGVPATEVPGGVVVPALRLDTERLLFGQAANGEPSWTERALRLRDRVDLGPFRLAYLEALVRIADWRASRSYREGAAACTT